MRIEERWPGLERSAGEHDPVPPAGRRRRSLRLAGLARGDGAAGVEETERDRLPRGHRAAAGRAGAGPGGRLRWRWRACWSWSRPESSRIALRRLFLPFGGQEWPQQTHLVLDEREHHAEGRAGRFVHAGGARSGPATRSPSRRRRPIASPTATESDRAAPHRSKGANSAAGSSRSISRSASR